MLSDALLSVAQGSATLWVTGLVIVAVLLLREIFIAIFSRSDRSR
ncbi:MAG: hypothetical protein ACYTG3_11930 [Planctomycetota bacterium]|jgi:hypothetical protein